MPAQFNLMNFTYQSDLFNLQNDRCNRVCTTHTYGNNDNVITISVELSTVNQKYVTAYSWEAKMWFRLFLLKYRNIFGLKLVQNVY